MPTAPLTMAPGPDDPAGADTVRSLAAAPEADEALGDAQARHFGRMAYVQALHLTGHPEDARDIAQDAMVRWLAHRTSIGDGRNPGPWLVTTVRNLVTDLWRRRRVRPTESIDAETFVRELPASDASPVDRLERRDLQRQVWRAVASLPVEKREILMLRDVHDLSYADIASVLGIPAGTVMSRLHGARTALRAALRAEGTHG